MNIRVSAPKFVKIVITQKIIANIAQIYNHPSTVDGLLFKEAMDKFSLSEGLIITENER